ncbi:MAG: FlgO family outer membrane protein [Elusimicrobiota bacterium]
MKLFLRSSLTKLYYRFFIISLCLICLLFLFCVTANKKVYAEKNNAQSFSRVIQGLTKKLNNTIKSDRMTRLAVLIFVPTKNTIEAKNNEFGEYFSESLISALSANQQKFKLFERKRLNLILEENRLSLSGLIDENEAKKIGELAPIDVILSGTYTKLKDYIDINSRLIDVVTGEILLSYLGRIELTADINILFEEKDKESTKKEPTQKDPYIQKQERINLLLSDLSTPDKIQALVKEAINIPFDTKCGKVHFTIMSHFEKYQIESLEYKAFLVKEVDNISFPSRDWRSGEVLKYLAKDNVIDQQEWEFGLSIIKKLESHNISSHLSTLFNVEPPPVDLKETYERIDQYFLLVRNKNIGLPIPIDFNTGFFGILKGFKDNKVLIYCYSKYKQDLNLDAATTDSINSFLLDMYFQEKDLVQKEKILDWICEFFNQRNPDEKLADDIFTFASRFEITDYMEKNPEKMAEIPASHFKKLIELCKVQFSKSLPFTKFLNQKEERVNFCMENNIDCHGFIPTIDECIKMLSSTNEYERMSGIEILEKMKEKAKKAEEAVINVLKTEGDLHRHAIIILGNIKTTYPKALELLIDSLGSFDTGVPDMAIESLAKIGEPAIPYLIKNLNSRDESLIQWRIAVVLGMIGPAAKSAQPALKKLLESPSRKVQIEAEKALEKIVK